MANSRWSILLLLLLSIGGCVPAQPASNPSASPRPQPNAPVATDPPPSPVDPAQALTVAPDNWWLLDPATDRVFGTGAERAYRELLAGRRVQRTVVVAVLDSGIDIEHEDLDENIWVNADEIPGNGRDDDANGYVDDVHGWSFLGGPSGEDVHYDTYEVTRLYVGCRERGELETTRCQALEAELEAERTEATTILAQYRTMTSTLEQVTGYLERFLSVDSLTPERVAAIQTVQPTAMQARQIYLQFNEAGVTPEALEDGIESLTAQVEYGLNPEFDPRPIVGDDYANTTERIYGTNRVEGPAAEHGTHVAGIIGAERANGVGVDGIAPAVEIMVVRAVPMGDERDKDVANAIRYAVDNGAHIINMSFGKGFSPQKDVVDEAVRYAQSRGVLMVHAAGNDGADVDVENHFPNRFYQDGGAAELWIDVGASNWVGADRLAASFSNYGRANVDVFAPGVAILSTSPDNQYEQSQGTSVAAPVVSGVAALLMAYFPELSAAQVRQVILETATRFPGQRVELPGGGGSVAFEELSVTGGIVNAYAAVQRAAQLVGGGAQ
jgi:subtilisin family serine protease